ncbi:pyridoxal phosphate-dependent aminotransferase [Flavisolibacter ginsengisoli]|jgi:aspartate aminotransferase|uniref:Aminotransferase n=1 Tax=Flavisolibacter ginsengisoli DSM 18119 TaxID=1121884 RepID=A0A1M5BVL5_9BACT|nr:pyridoxal phosphate-dependent aminotransferase [Flavisolibacter ginsengisoli]SHF46460.1 aspartate aminotransferase [Flavisolibacter ginsengisoli DSM 18119]
MELSSLLSRFSEPETLRMAKLGRELRAKGLDIIDLSLGEPDFDTPEHIKEAAKKAIDENWSHYTPVSGYLDLRQAVCSKFKRDNNLDYKPENIVVSTGAKQSLANAILSIVETGDQVIIPTPFWVTYQALVDITGAEAVLLKSSLEHGYKITPEELEAAITPRTKLFIFSSPCNPSGSVYKKDELEGLARVFEKYPHIYIISDEIYEYINYGGKPESIAQFDYLKDRTIIINGLSKGFAMTGWRLGYMAAPVEIAKACEKLQGQFTSGTSSITQRAAITALTAPLDATHEMLKEFERRRKRVMELMHGIEGFKFSEPDGAFYAFPCVDFYFGKSDGEEVIKNADDLCMYLLNKAHVSTVTGSAFGDSQCLRLSFANSMENIEKGFARITEALKKLK